MLKDRAGYLANLIHSSIPIVKNMGIRITEETEGSFLFSAPLDINKNDKGTAFAGSLYSLLVLTGWGFVTMGLLDENIDAQVVISKGEITYHKPVSMEHFAARCQKPDPEKWELFKKSVKDESKGKISLIIEIAHAQEVKVTFNAVYYGRLK